MPSLQVDNHMICTVLLDGEYYYLDATEKYSDLNAYAYRIEGKDVMIEDGEDFLIKKIPVTDLSNNRESYTFSFGIDDDVLHGQAIVEVAGNRKTWLYNVLNSYKGSAQNEVLNSYLSNSDKNIFVDFGANKIDLQRDGDFECEYKITIDNQVTKLADELYLSLEFDQTYKSSSIPEDRTRPLTLRQRYYISAETELKLPENATVSYIPEPVKVVNDKYEFLLSYVKKESSIYYEKYIKIKSPILEVDEFEAWNKAIQSISDFYSDQLIFQLD